MQVYNEAVKILYDENEFLVGYSRFETELPGVLFRKDDPRNAFATSRQLRNGRSVDMVNHTGLIYRSIFYRLRNVELHLDILDMRHPMGSYMNPFLNGRFQSIMETLYKTICDSSSKELSAVQASNKNWSLVVHSLARIRYNALKKMLKPILRADIAEAVQQGNLQIVLSGDFPRNWEILFHDFIGPGLSAEEVDAAEETGDDKSNGFVAHI